MLGIIALMLLPDSTFPFRNASHQPPKPFVIADRVDELEQHHKLNAHGGFEWTQVIGWDLTRGGRRCVFFAMNCYVRRSGALYYVEFVQLKQHFRVESREFNRTWSHNDPEVDDRKLLPMNKRRVLGAFH